MSSAWYPNEREGGGPEHLDADYVAGYDAKTQLDLDVEAGFLVETSERREGFGDVIDGWEPDVGWLRGKAGYRDNGEP